MALLDKTEIEVVGDETETARGISWRGTVTF
jgi:hypothetical protein